MVRNTTDRIRISKKGKALIDADIRRTGKTSAQVLDHYLNISTDESTTLPTPVAPPETIRRVDWPQPPQGLVDAFIMHVLGVTRLLLIPDLRIDAIPKGLNLYEWGEEVKKRTLALQAEIAKLPQLVSRKTIVRKVKKEMIDRGWENIYPFWFEFSKSNHSDFITLIDKRLASLVTHQYLNRSKGYSFSQNELLHREIDTIAGIVNLIPQEDLKIKKLLQRNLFQVDTYRDYVTHISMEDIDFEELA